MGKRHIAVALVLLATSLMTVPWGTSPAGAALIESDYPAAWEVFPACSTPEQEFCIESLSYKLDGSATTTPVANPAFSSNSTTDEPSVRAVFYSAYTGPNTPPTSSALFYYPILEVRIVDSKKETASYTYSSVMPTKDGLPQGVYTAVVRTGDLDPAYMLLQGKHESYSIAQGADGHYTATFSGRPRPFADVPYDNWDECNATNWLSDCESTQAFRGYLAARFVMLRNATIRSGNRGGWFATNAARISVVQKLGEYDITIAGPHFMPDDFGDETLTKEGGRSLNPAFFEIYMPYKAIAGGVSTKLGITVDAEMVKNFLTKHKSEMVTGTIKQADSASATPREVARRLTLTLLPDGLLVDFNLTHFSAPNPKVKSQPPTSRAVKKISNGAVVSVVKTAKLGTTLSSTSLYMLSNGSSLSRVTSLTKSTCVVIGKSVKAVKRGTCKIVFSVKKGTKTSDHTASITVK